MGRSHNSTSSCWSSKFNIYLSVFPLISWDLRKKCIALLFLFSYFLFSYSCTMLKMKQLGVVLLLGENSMYALLSHSKSRKKKKRKLILNMILKVAFSCKNCVTMKLTRSFSWKTHQVITPWDDVFKMELGTIASLFSLGVSCMTSPKMHCVLNNDNT